jgi:hypothetical protein
MCRRRPGAEDMSIELAIPLEETKKREEIKRIMKGTQTIPKKCSEEEIAGKERRKLENGGPTEVYTSPHHGTFARP